MTSSKKSETIEVRLPFAAKTAFAERCRADGVTMSDAIRRFVEGHGRARHGIAGPLAVIALLALAVVMSPVAARPDYGAGFDELDRNGDGVVTQAEVPGGETRCPVALALPLKRGWLGNGPRSFAICREVPAFAVLDRDGDGLVTRKEFAAHAIASLRRGFDALDEDGDGLLDAGEYAAPLRMTFIGTPPDRATFHDLDSNGDRRVSFTEFID
ncbi:MAG: EF-hand domain-containing protein [Sphingomonas sp.]|uniref:EF-hand domain-containing protein n=1 Tax=Sphingomonas sp. TaxID=28214 RepID=UPI0025E17E9F|nr:EF-hand domain-containing protein [Sphingomonas sp.]MBX3564893.1 EF-hand domain-containing protein [Sphingomonas sp.]